MKPVVWGVLSVSVHYGLRIHTYLSKSPLVQLRGIASRDKQRAENAARDLGMPRAYGSYEELLADKEIAILLLMLVCFVAGIFARTGLGRKMKSWVDNSMVASIPAYQVLKSMAEGMAEIESSANVRAALARIEDAWQPALVLEELENGLLTVFVPQAPTPMSGSVFYLTAERVKMLVVPISSVLICIRRMGLGSQALLRGRTDLG